MKTVEIAEKMIEILDNGNLDDLSSFRALRTLAENSQKIPIYTKTMSDNGVVPLVRSLVGNCDSSKIYEIMASGSNVCVRIVRRAGVSIDDNDMFMMTLSDIYPVKGIEEEIITQLLNNNEFTKSMSLDTISKLSKHLISNGVILK